MNRFVSPSPFDVRASIEYLLMAVAGGLGPPGRRAGRLGAGADAEERPAGRAADADAARRPARGGRLRDALHPAAALRARRADGLRAALDARALPAPQRPTQPRCRAGRAAAAPRAAGARHADPVGDRRGQALRRAGGGQRRELRRQRRRDRRPDRPQRRRQVDHVQPADLHAADDGRAGALPRPRHRRHAAARRSRGSAWRAPSST